MNNSLLRSWALLLLLQGCQSGSDRSNIGPDTITRAGLEKYLKKISSDEFEGRKPFTNGEVKTINYLVETLKSLDVEPGNGTSYIQEVPMVSITALTDSTMNVKGAKENIKLRGF